MQIDRFAAEYGSQVVKQKNERKKTYKLTVNINTHAKTSRQALDTYCPKR